VAKNGILSAKQRQGIEALMLSKSTAAAAAAAGVPHRTMCRWIKDDDAFRVALSAAETAAIGGASRRLCALAGLALDALEGILRSSDSSDSVKVRAADSILGSLLKLRELRDVEVRLSELERRMVQNDCSNN
jgi:hypothetical protein